ncbi:hypothetical protein FNO01nite_17730 [Flavobacterium noncentrifugens]|uniref:Nucleotide-binding universal stress protein, UspA family n=1 Tax=Flavobacterium noncentrifugens TaxID=1128970 RepID=A0A1G8WZ70_9FLAO|nr:universal stress protein [Flavobacterium noncentrifugens]GEP51101.1 hypothetical protein FNO01nite_17730 [Flavobacterium noncentrifugens]SDJ83573.1 Nucleotide-binding universal stress protein, UspA family [Flavobacterium noncentrifugens]
MKKILFPTDFSEVSKNAFVYALKLAENIDAEIITLHVYELPVVNNTDGFPSYLVEIYDVVELSQFESYKGQIPLLRDIAEANNLGHIKLSHELLMGDLVGNIKEISKKEQIDYIVLGTKGASGLKETFLGSTASDVLSNTDAIVLAIPEKSHYSQIKNIAFTSRFREKDRAALLKLLKLANGFAAKVHCLYVKTPSSDLKEVVLADWQLLFKNENVDFHIVENENVEETILHFTETENIDLLAMLHYKRSFLEGLFHFSLTKKIVHHVQIPILALHEN